MAKIIKSIRNPRRCVQYLMYRYYSKLKFIPDKPYLKIMYWVNMGKRLDLIHPSTYNEKLQWLKLYYRRDICTRLVDKYEVKKYVSEIIGTEYVVPNYGVWDKFDDIDFSKLPNQFVLKCTHDCGGLVICKNKENLDIAKAKAKIEKCLKKNFYWMGREWPYKNVKPRIIAEEYLEDSTTQELRDYKFFTFNGKVRAMFIASDRQNPNTDTKFDFYDRDFCHLPFTNGHPNSENPIKKPVTFNLMTNLAEQLSKDFPHVRVDFYEVDGKVYFGEMTFSHWSGFQPFKPEKWDQKFGEWLHLPEKKG